MLSQELIMKTAELFYKSQDYKLKANAESYKENVTNIYAQGRIRLKIQNLNRMREYFNVFIANHSAGMPKIGHFYNENSSNNFREIKIRIRWLFLYSDFWQHPVSPLCSAYSKRFDYPE